MQIGRLAWIAAAYALYFGGRVSGLYRSGPAFAGGKVTCALANLRRRQNRQAAP
jgi:hypothetical protein